MKLGEAPRRVVEFTCSCGRLVLANFCSDVFSEMRLSSPLKSCKLSPLPSFVNLQPVCTRLETDPAVIRS